MEIMWSSRRERSRRDWSTSVGERLATGFLSAAFAQVYAMVGSIDLVFAFFSDVRGMLLRFDTSFGPGCLS